MTYFNNFFSVARYGTSTGCGAALPWTWGLSEETVEQERTTIIFEKDVSISTSAEEAERTFTTLKSCTKNLKYFPSDSSRFLQLIYYADLSDTQNPYSQTDCVIFNRSHISDLYTKRWLRLAAVSAVAFPVIGWSLTTDPGSGWMAASLVVSSMASATISWIATGSNPDFKSDSANERQDSLSKFPETFLQIARVLVRLNKNNPYLAYQIAVSLDIEKIGKKMLENDPRATKAPDLMALESAKHHVLGEPLPDTTPLIIELYINSIGRSD